MTTPQSAAAHAHPAAAQSGDPQAPGLPTGTPMRWVPTLYLAQGLPFYTVALIAGLMAKSQGVANDQIARWTGLLGLAWVFKPLWSPFLEAAPSKKWLVVLCQYTGALALGGVEQHMPPAQAWTIIFALLGLMMAALASYHLWALPPGAPGVPQGSAREVLATLWDVVHSFFTKPGIWLAIGFIVLFRAGEGQIQTIGPLFLRDARSAGGLGLSTDQVGIVYGTAGTVAFIAGSVLGGYFTAWRGLKRAMPWLIVAMNLPNLVFWWLGTALPDDLGRVSAALAVEMFGYGFGFVGVILFIMQVVAAGKYPTAHYALGTGVMQL
ncbi:MAG: hypothetical protein CFE45_32685, partial [Burkholderiales bacterium PBB5]